MSDAEQSVTIRVWRKASLGGAAHALPRATSLMQKNTSWRCFVRCFYIKHFSSILLVCQREIKAHLFSNVLWRGVGGGGFSARCCGCSGAVQHLFLHATSCASVLLMGVGELREMSFLGKRCEGGWSHSRVGFSGCEDDGCVSSTHHRAKDTGISQMFPWRLWLTHWKSI